MIPRTVPAGASLLLSLALALAACGHGNSGTSGDAPPDASTDGGARPAQQDDSADTAAPQEVHGAGVGSPTDTEAGTAPTAAADAGSPTGSGSTTGSGAAADAGSTTSGTTTGSGSVADAGSSTGTVTPKDAGVAPSGSSTRDAGAPPATGTVVDAGSSAPPKPPADAGQPAGGTWPGSGLWVTGYYPGWTRSSLAPTDIDYSALTHLVDFSLHPNTDGTIQDTHTILPTAAATIAAAHAGGVKVLVCIGGANTVAGFQGATDSAHLATFVDALVATVTRYGYDGVDLDWEPLSSADRPQYVALVNALQPRLAALTPRRVLTTAVDSWSASTVAQVASRFDQVNVMTYDMAGTTSDWVSWFNSPLTGGGAPRPSGNVLPSADLSVNKYLTAGIGAPKLGIGIAFYGNLWTGGAGTSTGGVSAPRQSWTSAPSMTAIDYRTIMGTWYQPGLYHFDVATGSAWLGIDAAGSANDHFITYDDEATIALKLAWVKTHGLGGVIIWQLGSAYFPTAPAGQKDPLLQAVKLHR